MTRSLATQAARSKTERLAHVGEATGVGRLIRELGAWNGIMAFAYHRVGVINPAYDSGVWDASPAQFERQLRFLKREFDVIGPDDLETVMKAGRGRYVLLTFDDGYRDNVEEALPILIRHGLPATFFVTTGFLDRREIAWWDEVAWMIHASPRPELELDDWLDRPVSLDPTYRAHTTKLLIDLYKRLPCESAAAFLDALADASGSGRHGRDRADMWMTWDDVRALHAAGMHIGGHTVGHPLLARLSPAEQDAEIAACKARIERELGKPMRSFSYPDGGRDCFDEHTRRCLADHGVEFGFSFYGGYRRFDDWDPYDIRRRCLGPGVSVERFALMLTFPQVFAWR
jgi:peptidoglycan/xylan/chitin deacetylase (PgdA/CDA1 family)